MANIPSFLGPKRLSIMGDIQVTCARQSTRDPETLFVCKTISDAYSIAIAAINIWLKLRSDILDSEWKKTFVTLKSVM